MASIKTLIGIFLRTKIPTTIFTVLAVIGLITIIVGAKSMITEKPINPRSEIGIDSTFSKDSVYIIKSSLITVHPKEEDENEKDDNRY